MDSATKATDDALMDVRAERERQIRKWGSQDHPLPIWVVINMEEMGEWAKEALAGNLPDFRKEGKEVAAVAVAAMESIERQLAGQEPRTAYTNITDEKARELCTLIGLVGDLSKAYLEGNKNLVRSAVLEITLMIL